VLNPPSILFDLTFLSAVADTDHTNHDEATSLFRTLIDDFVDQRFLLVARADHLAAAANANLFAPIDKIHVARQHRNAAAELAARTEIDIDLAITLVLLQRNRIRKVASFDERLENYDLDILTPPANFVAPEALGDSPATYLQPESS
jgi:predicted nucleic acid-binding protein